MPYSSILVTFLRIPLQGLIVRNHVNKNGSSYSCGDVYCCQNLALRHTFLSFKHSIFFVGATFQPLESKVFSCIVLVAIELKVLIIPCYDIFSSVISSCFAIVCAFHHFMQLFLNFRMDQIQVHSCFMHE